MSEFPERSAGATSVITTVVLAARRLKEARSRDAAARVQAVARAGNDLLSVDGARWFAELERAVDAHTATGSIPSLFNAMGLSYRERHYNRALGWLLSPQAEHGAARIVLEVLAEELKCPALLEDIRAGGDGVIKVRTEARWPSGANSTRQPDLLVMSRHALLLIENKVRHVEGYRQYPDYLHALNRLAQARGITEARSFLCAPDHRETPDGWSDSITHADLSAWIAKAARRETMATWDRVLCLLVAEEICATGRSHLLREAEDVRRRVNAKGLRARDVRRAQEILSRLGEPSCPWRTP